MKGRQKIVGKHLMHGKLAKVSPDTRRLIRLMAEKWVAQQGYAKGKREEAVNSLLELLDKGHVQFEVEQRPDSIVRPVG
jgi:hypothetical protein